MYSRACRISFFTLSEILVDEVSAANLAFKVRAAVSSGGREKLADAAARESINERVSVAAVATSSYCRVSIPFFSGVVLVSLLPQEKKMAPTNAGTMKKTFLKITDYY